LSRTASDTAPWPAWAAAASTWPSTSFMECTRPGPTTCRSMAAPWSAPLLQRRASGASGACRCHAAPGGGGGAAWRRRRPSGTSPPRPPSPARRVAGHACVHGQHAPPLNPPPARPAFPRPRRKHFEADPDVVVLSAHLWDLARLATEEWRGTDELQGWEHLPLEVVQGWMVRACCPGGGGRGRGGGGGGAGRGDEGADAPNARAPANKPG